MAQVDKRTRSDDISQSEKRTKIIGESDILSERTFLKMLIVNADCGRVIGKGGAVLSKIMNDSGAKIRLSRSDEAIHTGERVAMISGSLLNACSARRLISELLLIDENNDELKILIPEVSVGYIIGKGGVTIKEIMNKTDSRIQVSKSEDAVVATNERILGISGSEDAKDKAIVAVYEKLLSLSTESHPKDINYSILKNISSSVGGGGGSELSYGQVSGESFYQHGHHSQDQCSLPPPPPHLHQYPQEPHSFSSPSQQFEHEYPPGLHIQPTFGGVSSPQLPPPMSLNYHPRHQQPQELWQQQHRPEPVSVPAPTSYLPRPTSSFGAPLSIPDRFVAGVIGRGGSVIRDINIKSGAKVRLSQKNELNEKGERTLIIEGALENCLRARALVEDRMSDLEAALGVGLPSRNNEYPPATARVIAHQEQQQQQHHHQQPTWQHQPPPPQSLPPQQRLPPWRQQPHQQLEPPPPPPSQKWFPRQQQGHGYQEVTTSVSPRPEHSSLNFPHHQTSLPSQTQPPNIQRW